MSNEGSQSEIIAHRSRGLSQGRWSAHSNTGALPVPGNGTPKSTPKALLPETITQARHWELVKQRYLRCGLCHKCACQAAWGHQIGWTNLEYEPCPTCAPIVAQLPDATASTAWRKTPRKSARPYPSSGPEAMP